MGDCAQAVQPPALDSAVSRQSPWVPLIIGTRPAHTAGKYHPTCTSTALELFLPHAAFLRSVPSISSCLGHTTRKITPKTFSTLLTKAMTSSSYKLELNLQDLRTAQLGSKLTSLPHTTRPVPILAPSGWLILANYFCYVIFLLLCKTKKQLSVLDVPVCEQHSLRNTVLFSNMHKVLIRNRFL